MLENGIGLTKDNAEAIQSFCIAAAQGDAWSQICLGLMYRDGGGVPKDGVEAARLLRLATAGGASIAPLFIASMYRNGHGALKDIVLSCMWYNIGGALGDYQAAEARDSLGKYEMTSAEISDAGRRAKICMASNYTDC